MTAHPARIWWAGPLYEALATACRYLLLSLAWTLCAAPLVTAPAATCALVATVRGWAAGHEGPVLATFLTRLRRSARTSTLAAALLLPGGALLAVNAVIVPHMAGQRPYLTVALASVALPYLGFCANLVPVLAAGDRGVRDAFRRTAERLVRHPAPALLTTAVAVTAALCLYVQPLTALVLAAPAARLAATSS
ncbi:DUF624 domain-containing protein [Streptomyces sp. NPDC093085]|uniref:DUF624 domain-containing protein n=1 Tax=Streptomyces sp. NPDC093085 TaxID=3155068 RepID=UPI003425C8EE